MSVGVFSNTQPSILHFVLHATVNTDDPLYYKFAISFHCVNLFLSAGLQTGIMASIGMTSPSASSGNGPVITRARIENAGMGAVLVLDIPSGASVWRMNTQNS
jgi:hypothetical protein